MPPQARHLLLFELALVVCKPQSSGLLNGNRKPLLFRYALRFNRLQIRSLDRYAVVLASSRALSLYQWRSERPLTADSPYADRKRASG
jgi:hypothetical protein